MNAGHFDGIDGIGKACGNVTEVFGERSGPIGQREIIPPQKFHLRIFHRTAYHHRNEIRLQVHYQVGINPTSISEQQISQLQIAIVCDCFAGGSALQTVLLGDQIVDEQQQLSAPHHKLIQFDLIRFGKSLRWLDDHQ